MKNFAKVFALTKISENLDQILDHPQIFDEPDKKLRKLSTISKMSTDSKIVDTWIYRFGANKINLISKTGHPKQVTRRKFEFEKVEIT